MSFLLFSRSFYTPNVPASLLPTAEPSPENSVLLVEEYDALAIAIGSALKKFAPDHLPQIARSLAEAETLAAGPASFLELMAAAGSRDGRELVRANSACLEF